jgi:hypothetical protein
VSNTKKFTNNTNISLSFAVHLATDLYDHNDDPNTISVTTLIRATKKVILASRVPAGSALPDLANRIKAQSGTALHTAIEYAWENNYQQAMRDLGYPEHIINKVRLNPTSEEVKLAKDTGQEIFPIYMERRSSKVVDGMTVSGKFDFVIEGKVEDFKRTSTYTYIKKTNDKDYIKQGSIYRWLNQDIITGDFLTIQYEFSDWNALALQRNPSTYPPHMQMAYSLPLMSIPETEAYVTNKVSELKRLWNSPEEDLPICTPEDLWQDPSTWKYYKNPLKTKRSTANFNSSTDAYARHAKDGGVGLVMEIKSKAKACDYCDAYTVCKQKDNYVIK